MKKLISFLLISNCLVSIFAAELTAKFVTTEAAKKETVEESVSYLKTQISKMTSAADKRAAYVFLASLEEQMALYDDAQKSYAQAAGISAGDCEGMPKKSNEQIVLDAVRCALSSGDYKTADSYLNSAVRNSKDEKIQAYIKLYSQWSALCKADSVADIQEPLVMLQAYTKIDSMEVVKPAILLTLWYLTGDKSYSQQISSKYPKSIESSIQGVFQELVHLLDNYLNILLLDYLIHENKYYWIVFKFFLLLDISNKYIVFISFSFFPVAIF